MEWYESPAIWAPAAAAIGAVIWHFAKAYIFVKKGKVEVDSKQAEGVQKRTLEEQNEAIKQLLTVMNDLKTTHAAELARERTSHTEDTDRLELLVGRQERAISKLRESMDALRREKDNDLLAARKETQICLIEKARYAEIIRNAKIDIPPS